MVSSGNHSIQFDFFFLKEPKCWFISLILCFFDLYLIISAFIFIIIFLFWGGWLCDSFPNLLSWELNFFISIVPIGLANLIHPFIVRLLERLCIFHIKHRVRVCFMSQCEKFVLLLGDWNPLTFCDMTDVWFQHSYFRFELLYILYYTYCVSLLTFWILESFLFLVFMFYLTFRVLSCFFSYLVCLFYIGILWILSITCTIGHDLILLSFFLPFFFFKLNTLSEHITFTYCYLPMSLPPLCF